MNVHREHLLREVAVRPGRRGGAGRPRVRLLALAAVVGAAACLSIPALGVGPRIVSLFAGWRDPGAPVPTASDVVVASGESGVPWRIVATRSDQGLCLGLFHRAGGDSLGSARCAYTGIRGDLPPDIRGDPASKCLATPTASVPCGSLPRHWIELGGSGASVGLEHMFAFGPLAADVDSVELVLDDGQAVRAHVVEQPEGLPLDFYWASWSCPLRRVSDRPYAGEGLRMCAEDRGPEVKTAIARDAGGRVLERRVPAWNLNPTGDPDGPPPPTPAPR
jgi:hypothetical protein